MGREKKVVEGRYWSYRVGGLLGVQGRLARAPGEISGRARGTDGPPGPRLAGWDASLTARPAQCSASPWRWGGRALQPLPCSPALGSASTCPAPLSGLLFFTLPPHQPPPSSLLPPISVRPVLRGPPASHHLGQSLPNCPRPTRALCLVGWALLQVGTSAQAAQQRQQKLAEDPALLRKTCQVQLALSVQICPGKERAGCRTGWRSWSPAQGHLTSCNPPNLIWGLHSLRKLVLFLLHH